LDGAELRVVADVGKLDAGAADHVDEAVSFPDVDGGTINENRHLSDRRSRKCTLGARSTFLDFMR
jgi:hypothetical protein